MGGGVTVTTCVVIVYHQMLPASTVCVCVLGGGGGGGVGVADGDLYSLLFWMDILFTVG